MTNPSLGRLLISHITLRGPELRQLYGLIEERPGITYEELLMTLMPAAAPTEFSLEEAPLREALNFLLVAGLAEQNGASRRRASFHTTPLTPNIPFAPLLLHHMLRHHDQRQQAPVLIHRMLVTHDILSITQAAIRDRMERGPLRDLFAWTSEKIALWTQLTHHLGLVRRLDRNAEVLIVPHPMLVIQALRSITDQRGELFSLDDLLGKIDTRFFACFTSRSEVHVGLAQTLVALHRLGQIQLSHSADATRSLLLGDWRVSEVRLVPTEECR